MADFTVSGDIDQIAIGKQLLAGMDTDGFPAIPVSRSSFWLLAFRQAVFRSRVALSG
ncbi:MAG: hypothetical protein HZT40_11290 [Candidatus Thiothrix singaporensis]|uniref:Uncharacterized protein n=1 Tax=Candidatus Thiothrix singaporensis TaxID=2799669 RepID=A0A7L6ASM0_9GAMM|nr:MAG: hypothetical protein HZT40_11290 [Candidatus Thiothrix singaporensis]